MARYDTVGKIEVKGVQKLGTAILPDIEENNNDVLLIATEGDRCDLLALQFYNDQSLWWFIANTNNLSSNNIPVGTQLRIPLSADQAVLT